MQIVAVSFNVPADNVPWVAKEEFEFEIWSDTNKSLALYYGAVDSKAAFFPNRITKLLDASGTLILEYTSVSVDNHPHDVLLDCQAIFGR